MNEEYKRQLEDIARQIVAQKKKHCIEFQGMDEGLNDTAILRFKDEDGGEQEWEFHFRDGKPFNSIIRRSSPI